MIGKKPVTAAHVPPVGRHGYVFKLYALDTVFSDLHQSNKTELEQAVAGYIIGKTGWVRIKKRAGGKLVG